MTYEQSLLGYINVKTYLLHYVIKSVQLSKELLNDCCMEHICIWLLTYVWDQSIKK